MSFIENFKTIADIAGEYADDSINKELEDAIIHLAWYGYGSYEGDSLVIYEKNGKLYENNGSHCSCYGLEGQWKPEETSWAALAKRKIYGGCDGSDEAQKVIDALVLAHQ